MLYRNRCGFNGQSPCDVEHQQAARNHEYRYQVPLRALGLLQPDRQWNQERQRSLRVKDKYRFRYMQGAWTCQLIEPKPNDSLCELMQSE